MARRGDKLQSHILYAAKDVFLEMGFERASMDVIAERAQTSKRTLYARFENKEKLYLAVVELVRTLVLTKLKTPADYADDPVEALVLFCGRLLEVSLYRGSIRMCRMAMAEAERFPEGSALYFDVIFTAPRECLSLYLQKTYALSVNGAASAAEKLIAQILYPRFHRALFGLDKLSTHLHEEKLSLEFDLVPVRKAVEEVTKALKL